MALNTPTTQSVRLGALFGLLAAGSYGINPPLARLAYEAGLSSATLVSVRSVVMLVGTALLVTVWRVRISFPPGAGWPVLVLGLSTAILSVSYLTSVIFIPVSLAVIIFYTFPILILTISVISGRERSSFKRWLIVAGVFAGLSLVIGPKFSGLDWRGVALAGISSLCAVAQFYSGAAATARMDLRAIVFWVHVITLPVVGLALAFSGVSMPTDAVVAWGAVAVASLGYVAGFFFQLFSLTRISPAASSLYFNAEPLVTLGIAVLLLGETLSALQITGAAMVISGLIASSLVNSGTK
ncbi:MAG: DMT family transporter [Hyphomicrobiales bacterium]